METYSAGFFEPQTHIMVIFIRKNICCDPLMVDLRRQPMLKKDIYILLKIILLRK